MSKYNILTDKVNNFFTQNKLSILANKPTSGSWVKGDIVVSNTVQDGVFGWICTTSGSPGSWETLKSADEITWNNISNKPATFPPTVGTTATTAFRGDQGLIAYNHSQTAHAPANAQKNSDIKQSEIEAALEGFFSVKSSFSHDYGYGTNEKPGGFISGFPGWGKDCLFLNTMSLEGAEQMAYDTVKINGNHINIPGNLNLGAFARIPEVQEEVKFRQDPSQAWVDPWVGYGCAIKANGNIATNATVAARSFYLGFDYGECGISVGNGDAASYETHNMKIRSWNGLGFHNNNDVCTILFDTRSGAIHTKGRINTDQAINIQGKMLYMQDWDPGNIGAGNVWIKTN